MDDRPYCIWPWFHQKVNTDGTVQPCCKWRRHLGPPLSTDQQGFLHGDFMQSLRAQFLRGEVPAACAACSYHDSVADASWSTRVWGWKQAELLGVDHRGGPQLLSHEVDISNVCNLRCRSCSQDRSTKWIPDAVALGQKPVSRLHSGWQLSPSQATTATRLSFLGGEPMLHQAEICDALELIQKHGDISSLSVQFSSNMTTPLSQRFVDLLAMCSDVQIDCSVDGVGPMNDYIRSDSTWPEVEANIAQIASLRRSLRNINWGICFTLSIFNAADFSNVVRWWSGYGDGKNIWIGTVLWPRCQDARNLPRDMKQRLIAGYRSDAAQLGAYGSAYSMVIKHLEQDGELLDHEWRSQLRSTNGLLDQRRGTDLLQVVPELAALLDQQ